MASNGSTLSQISMTQSQLKRTTCNICRERKVRCGREKPQCDRCRRSGQKCTYPSSQRDIADINTALHHLHSRLIQAETKLKEQVQVTAESLETSSSSNSSSTRVDSQLAYDLLVPDGEMDFSDLAFLEFVPSRYHHQPVDVDTANVSMPDQAQQKLELELSNARGGFLSLSDANVPIPHVTPSAWYSDAVMTGQALDSELGKRIEQTTPVIGIERLYQPYFDLVQRHITLIDEQRFLQSTTCTETHQCKALKYAVAMSGASACGESALALESYSAARFHLERAESQADNSSFLNLETAQALILVSRFESTQLGVLRGLLTIARLMQLVSMLGYDVLDQSSSEDQQDRFKPTPQPDTLTSRNIQELRQTYWTAFSMHCNAAANLPCCVPIKEDDIRTAVPISKSTTDSDTSQNVYLSDDVTNGVAEGFDVFALFVLAMRLVVCVDRHHQMTKKFISGGGPDYNFCGVHEKVEKRITNIINALSTPGFLDSPDAEFRVLTFVITLGVRISLFKTTVLASQKADFLGPVVGVCRTASLTAANAMCDVLLQADILHANQIPAYREMSLFIMRPLALAADIQLDMLRNGAQVIGSNMFSTNREIRHNLQTICSAMSACKPSTGEYDSIIHECLAFLDRTGLGRPFSAGLAGKPILGVRRGS